MEEKDVNKKLTREIFYNLIIAIMIMLYFILINFIYKNINPNIIISNLKIASFIVLLISITIFEIAYHKDSDKIAITGIEILVLSINSLLIPHIVRKSNFELTKYVLVLLYIYAIYYVLKSIIIYTKEKQKYLKSLSDIHQILNDTPIKKEAKKRNNLDFDKKM